MNATLFEFIQAENTNTGQGGFVKDISSGLENANFNLPQIKCFFQIWKKQVLHMQVVFLIKVALQLER